MNDLILGVKYFVLGITTMISTVTTSVFVAPKATPTPTPSPTAQIQKNLVVREGEYTYSGYSLKYSLSVPKNGGDINGNFSGVCEGPIIGYFAGGEGGDIKGSAQVDCKIAFLSYNLKATYTGKLYLKQGKVDLNWEGEIPYTQNSGSLSINFEPVN